MAAVLALLDGDRKPGATVPQAVAAQAAAALGVDGICAGLGAGSSGLVLAWGWEPVSVALEDLQFTLGQGPALDAADGAPVLVADLAAAAVRWPMFVPAAAELGVRALFALPLRIGAINVGVLSAHRANPGPLADGALGDAFALAEAVTLLLLHQQSTGTDERAGPSGEQPRAGSATYRAEVHQATGMISVQLGVSLAEALLRLRAHAYADGRAIAEVASDVVARRLRLDNQ
ncbi:MAG TPA: ANTAR domain-containing protein [Actinocrinis sp.]|nr:ANTAR domain-containing protein [Actinocrinis sp.]